MTETPQELRASERDPGEMNFAELTRFIRVLERSGADVNGLKVDRMLKIAIPVTCIIIALFGAPLATSSQRGGAAYGVAISLATTIIMLVPEGSRVNAPTVADFSGVVEFMDSESESSKTLTLVSAFLE